MTGVFAVPGGKSPSASHRQFNLSSRVPLDPDALAERIENALSYGFPEVEAPLPERDDPVAVVCGGPSLEHTYSILKAWPGQIWACNSVGNWLTDRGVCVDAVVHMDLDSKPDLLDPRLKDVPHYLGHAMRPDFFDAARDYNVILWHPWHGGHGDPDGKWCIGNGPTVGCRSVFLGLHLGFRKIHLFGMDGNFEDDIQHVYDADDENRYPRYPNGHKFAVRVNGREFITVKPFMRQAMVLRHLIALTRKHVRYAVHGDSFTSAVLAPKAQPRIETLLTSEQVKTIGRQIALETRADQADFNHQPGVTS